MSVIRVDKDLASLTLTVVAEFDAPPQRVWRLWADPRKLECWWGPPTHPATVEEHELTPGGAVTYFLTGPDGERSHGWWRVAAADPPWSLEFADGFADQDRKPVAELPTTTVSVRLGERDGGTRMVVRSVFASREHMEQVVRMGAVDAFARALGQMDALLDA